MTIEVVTGPTPPWLDTPPTAVTSSPPVQTKLQGLPFHELAWENFERLCLRLARETAEVEFCRMYGTKGQDQSGIDLYARTSFGLKYLVYQCKNEQSFGPKKIENAVHKFLEGEWAVKTEVFFICTRESLRSTERTNAIEGQRKLLDARGIRLESWDADELNILLKDKPKLVDEFFHRGWVEPFCGPEKATAIGNRMDHVTVLDLRNKLGRFYRNVFNSHDPGFPPAPGLLAAPLEHRYVEHDVYEQRRSSSPASPQPAPTPTPENRQRGWSEERNISSGREEIYSQRRRISESLAEGSRHILLGFPGTGKSSILRFLAIDLLSPEPRLPATTKAWGTFLPVWVSFPFWTRLLAERSTSLGEAVHEWLRESSEERLWPLFEKALQDERLLLLVDGIDEYTNESAGQTAKSLLEVFVSQRDCPVVATSRPAGLERLGDLPANWRSAQLAELAPKQQIAIAESWYGHRILHQSSGDLTPNDSALAARLAQTFVDDLRKSSDLMDLAKTPLLFCLLLYFKHSNIPLPPNRFLAYRGLVDHLLATHPKQRRAAALVTVDPDWSDGEMRKVMAALALEMQTNCPQGVISTDGAESAVEVFLQDTDRGFGLSLAVARGASRVIVGLGEADIGLLVKRSKSEVAFLHRSFQEYLSAVGLSRLPFANQLQIVTDRSADPQWRETLLALFHLTERPDEVELLLRAVQKRSASHLERLAVSSLLAEACAGPFNCPPSLAKEICQSMIDEIECGVWLPFREHLLKILLSAGLNSIALKDILYKKIPSWFPDRGWGLSSALEVMGDWPKTPELVNCLIRALHSRPEYSGGSTKALAKCVKEDEAIGERLAQIALGPFSTTIRSAALEAIVDGGPNHPALARAAEQLYNSPEPGIHLACVRWRRHSGLQNDRDLQFLLHLAIDDLSESSAPPASLFLQGWPRDSRVREVALRSVTATWPEPGPQIYRGLALKILIEGYADDPIVRETLTRLIRSGEFEEISFAGHEAWDSLVTHLKGAKDIVEAIDDWIRLPQSTDPMCLSIAALVGRTPTAKNKLIELLASSALPWWTAEGLLKGWGMRDPEASAALLAFASSNEAASIGSLLPQIIEGPKSCAARLFELFRDPNCRYPASVLKGILSLGTFEREELIETAFGFVRRKSIYDHGVAELLMENFGGELRVDDMARKMMQDRDGNFAAVAKFYSHDPELRKRTIDIVTPLPIRLRAVVVGTLIDGAKTNSFCLDMLRFYDFERDMTLKTSAAIAYYSAISATSSAIDADLQRLTETIDCSGPDFRERRRAAFCGLEILGRLDIFLAAQESYPPDRRLDLNIASSLETNVPLVRHILSRWPALKGNLGQHFWPTFSSGGEEWRPFLPLIDEYESPREEALEHIRRSSNVAHSLSIELLEFLARVQPRSRLLRDYCLSCFSGPVPGWNVVRKAAELLGRDFATDEETLQSLPRSQRDWDVLPPVFIALCEAWPNSQRLDEEIKRILKYRIYMGPEAVVLLRSVRSRPERVFRMITRLVAWSPSRSFQILHERYANPIVKRISRDPALRALVAARLASTASASEKTTLPGLLGAARGIDSALRDWCVGEIDRQLSGNFPPEVGFDLLSGQYRPVHEVLYELLAPSLSRSPVSG